ncbi:Uncharacterized protein HZ326_20989 [Fusarium oxysporum f. sp. albedinis]|nr:Uncharacterized protein HZ326_20989 [Fusarium oxysporum f. sp. albedinis]
MSSDTSSIIGATENPPDVNGLPSNFLSIMDITKDRSSTRGRKTGGKCCQSRQKQPPRRIQIHQVCIGHPALNLRTFSPCSKRGRTSKCLQPAGISGSIDQHTHASESALFGY